MTPTEPERPDGPETTVLAGWFHEQKAAREAAEEDTED
jgi:hypothetical protein